MTQPNQSELEQQIVEYATTLLEARRTNDYQLELENRRLLTAYITANYTPNTKVLLLESRIAWLEGKLEGLTPDPLGDVFEANGYTVVDCTPKKGGNK